MQSLTIEYQRFGDSTGVLRLSDRYIRTIGATQPTDEVSFALPQENLTQAMALLDYNRFADTEADARATAERMLEGLARFVEPFLCGTSLPADTETTLQIDVVARPLELAQLPFEIIEETRPHVIVTRRIRQPWPAPEVVAGDQPRILFAWAAPRRMDVPHAQHRALLDEIVRDLGGANVIDEVANATRATLADRLGRQPYTHVHLLVHGVPRDRSAPDDPFDLTRKPQPSAVLALETDDGRIDRCAPEVLAGWLSRGPKPQVVTVATCHSAEIRPIESGGTIAHTLHAAGVPIVLASQLALTKDGSEFLVSDFLRPVIEGEDPRAALRRCRDRLRREQEKTYYDRVALVGYVHLDPGLEERLKNRRFRVALDRLKAISADARNRLEQTVASIAASKEFTPELRAEADAIRSRFEKVREGLDKLAPDRSLSKAQREELFGLRASSFKREAEAAFSLAFRVTGADAAEWSGISHDALRQAAVDYGRAARVSRDHHWTWVQWLVLLAVQDGDIRTHEFDWAIAEAAARDAVERASQHDADVNRRLAAEIDAVWAQGSLCELYLLSPLVGRGDAVEQAKQCLDALVDGARKLGRDDAIGSTLDQLARYPGWWGKDPAWKLPREIVTSATTLRAYLLEKSRGSA